MSHPASARLLLDEMFSPAIAAALRDLDHDVIAVAERTEMRAMSDEEVFTWAASQGRWLLTENVKDFRPILLRALQADTSVTGAPMHEQSLLSAFQEEPWPADSGNPYVAAQRATRGPAHRRLAPQP
jgi:hypothetical protein